MPGGVLSNVGLHANMVWCRSCLMDAEEIGFVDGMPGRAKLVRPLADFPTIMHMLACTHDPLLMQ